MRPTKETDLVTVAGLRERREDGAVEVLLNQRQQIYVLPTAERKREAVAGRLREALERRAPVRATLNPRRGVIEAVAEPSDRERREFEKRRVPLESPQKPRRIDARSIDPTTFNIVEHYLDVPVFKLCKNVIPSYKVAKEIFDFCAAQSCHLPGPPAISHCIPFQYVRDGCYARAHKMRQIIEDKYGYCSEKVFSFANEGNNTLAVKAGKWGGCCVTWWYHVAPLVRVRVRIKILFLTLDLQLAMVIDPGMFDKPVLLSTWLAAQEDTTCTPFARMSMYSIQPSSAYWPANLAGTQFDTDPSYTSTHQYLTLYKNLTTCP